MKNLLLISLLSLSTVLGIAQCPIITCPPSLTFTNCTTGETVLAVSDYSANITSRWIGPGNLPIASSGTDSSVVYLNHSGTYTVEFRDNLSNCVVIDTVKVTDGTAYPFYKPTFDVGVNSFTVCSGAAVALQIKNAIQSVQPGGALTFTLTGPLTGSVLSSGFLSTATNYNINTCGNWMPHVKDFSNGCISSYDLTLVCSTLAPTPIIFAGANTVCAGSSTSYTWSNGQNTGTANVLPLNNSSYTVSSPDANGCISSGAFSVTVNPMCSQVWPGDANSDGIVNNSDVLEIGLAINNTGPARNPGGNVYVSQYANNWTGNVSTGKNRCHADCNGNGLVDLNDTLAIYNNFSLTHAFRQQLSFGSDSDLSLSASDTILNKGQWGKVTVVLGREDKTISQMYGLAFDLNYDNSLIEPDSIYLVFGSSFLNAGSQNIHFRRPVFNSGALYAATVRTDLMNVTGYGDIAEVFFKLKEDLPPNSALQLGVSNVHIVSAGGTRSNLSAGNIVIPISNLPTALNEVTSVQDQVGLFPNPAHRSVALYSSLTQETTYSITDLAGKEVKSGHYITRINLDLSELAAGMYMIRFQNKTSATCKKLVIER